MLKRLTALLALMLSLPTFAYNVGDKVGNICWMDSDNNQVCLNDYPDDVRVLLFNAGWCGPCNDEFSELNDMDFNGRRRIQEFDGKPVTFISISAEGWSRGDRPDSAFLKSWKRQHDIDFPVVGAYRDFGRDFFRPPLFDSGHGRDRPGRNSADGPR